MPQFNVQINNSALVESFKAHCKEKKEKVGSQVETLLRFQLDFPNFISLLNQVVVDENTREMMNTMINRLAFYIIDAEEISKSKRLDPISALDESLRLGGRVIYENDQGRLVKKTVTW